MNSKRQVRPTRFRAWDSEHRQMLYLDRLDITGHEGGWWDDENGYEHGVGEDAPLMQFTGLHDKNGKEVWEGDIVGIQWPNGFIAKGKIIWHPIMARFSWFADGGDGYYLDQDADDREVLGNIYENPELLAPQSKQEGGV